MMMWICDHVCGVPDPSGMSLPEMLASADLAALWVVGANPLNNTPLAGSPFLVVQDLFLT